MTDDNKVFFPDNVKYNIMQLCSLEKINNGNVLFTVSDNYYITTQSVGPYVRYIPQLQIARAHRGHDIHSSAVLIH